jgi:hypothetical protein
VGIFFLLDEKVSIDENRWFTIRFGVEFEKS